MGQIARSADRKLLARVNERLDLALPEGAKEIGRSIDVYRNAPGAIGFSASAFVRWRTKRGREDGLSLKGRGRDPDGANVALTALLSQLDPSVPAPVKAPRGALPAKPTLRPTPKSEALDRGLVAAARKLLGYLVPRGATAVKRSVRVVSAGPQSRFTLAVATATWTALGKPGRFEASAKGQPPAGANVALAQLLSKLERAPIPKSGAPRVRARAPRRGTRARG